MAFIFSNLRAVVFQAAPDSELPTYEKHFVASKAVALIDRQDFSLNVRRDPFVLSANEADVEKMKFCQLDAFRARVELIALEFESNPSAVEFSSA